MLKSRLFIPFVVALFVLSCFGGCRGRVVVNDFEKITKMSIVVPKTLRATFNGEDTLLGAGFDTPLTLIVYADSSECGVCKVGNMGVWSRIINFAEQHRDRVSVCFILVSRDRMQSKQIRSALKSAPIHYPVFLDEQGDFEKMNGTLPKEVSFHTFLMDQQGNVVLVGSPLQNAKLEALFYKIVLDKN